MLPVSLKLTDRIIVSLDYTGAITRAGDSFAIVMGDSHRFGIDRPIMASLELLVNVRISPPLEP